MACLKNWCNMCCNCTCFNEPVAQASSKDGKVRLISTRSPIFVYNDFGSITRLNFHKPYTTYAVFWLFDVSVDAGKKHLNLRDKDDIAMIDHATASDGTPMLMWGDCCLSGLVFVNHDNMTNIYQQKVDKWKQDNAGETKTAPDGTRFMEVTGEMNYNIRQAKRFETRENLFYNDREADYVPGPEVASLPVCNGDCSSRCWMCCCVVEDFLLPPCYGVCCRE